MASLSRDLSVSFPNCSSLIKCSICHDILKDPKILSCFHHFCAECIGEHHRQTQEGNEAKCPICRRPFVLDLAGASDLPTCPYAQTMLDEIEKVKREKKDRKDPIRYCNAMCQDENVTRKAVFSCSTCPCDLCENCLKAHTKFLKAHILISLDESETDKYDPILKKITEITTSTCSLHSQNEVDKLCRECSIPFCEACESDHSEHEVITLQTIKRNTKTVREEIAKRKDVLEKCKGDLNGFMIMLQTGEEKALREISDYYNGWIHKLNEHLEKITEDLRTKSTRTQKDVIIHLKYLDDQSVYAEQFLHNLNRLYAAGNNRSTLSTWDLINESFEKLKENEKNDIYLPEKFAFRFVKPPQDFQIFGKIIEAKAYYDLYGMFRDKEQTMEESDTVGNDIMNQSEEQENAINESAMSIPNRRNTVDDEYEDQENGQHIHDNFNECEQEDKYEDQENGQNIHDDLNECEQEDKYEDQENGQHIHDDLNECEQDDYTVVHKDAVGDRNEIPDESTDCDTDFDDDEEYTDAESQHERPEDLRNYYNDDRQQMSPTQYLNGSNASSLEKSESPPLPPRKYKEKDPFVCLHRVSLGFEVSGGTMLPDGQIMLTSYNEGAVMILKESGEILKRVKAKFVWDAATTCNIDSSGFVHVYVTFVKPSARKKARIDVYTTEGVYHGLFSKDVDHPLGIACSSTDVFVSDKSVIKVFFVSNGSLKYKIRNTLFKNPWSIALKTETQLLVSDFEAHCVFLINLQYPSVIVKTYEKTTDSDTSEFLPGKCLYRRRICFLSDQGGGKVRVVTESGRLRTIIRDIYPGIKFTPLLLLMDSKDNLVIVSMSGQIAIMGLDFEALADYTNVNKPMQR